MKLISDLISSDRIHFFSLARYALIEALRISGVTQNDYVLIPEYICKEIVEEIGLYGANVLFYKVDDNLNPAESPCQWPRAKAVLMVNYFGFSQDLSPFQQYKKRVGSTIIEDNAHGLLSRDSSGKWLGMRTDIGIFSLRKTLCLSDGAALFLGGESYNFITPQLKFTGNGFSPIAKLRCKIKNIPLIGIFLQIFSMLFLKAYRGTVFGLKGWQYKSKIAHIKNPNKDLIKDLMLFVDYEKDEIFRRRDLYYKFLRMAKKNKLKPIFDQIPDGTTPYCFPIRATKNEATLFNKKINYLGLRLIKWPDLPNGTFDDSNYSNIWIINFL